MCCNDDEPEVPFTFTRFADLLEQPPFEPCESELQFLTADEYNAMFDEVRQQYFRPVEKYIAYLLREERGVAADLTQQVFISLYYAQASFERAYIYKAAKNAVFDELRRRGRESRALRAYWKGIKPVKSEEEVDALDPAPLPDAVLISRRREEALRGAVDRLPEYFRVPLMMFVEGKSYIQITEATKANMGTVKSRICRGKRLLRRRLRAYL